MEHASVTQHAKLPTLTMTLTQLARSNAGRVLPAMKHAAEELRAQREGAGAGGGVPSLRQAARSADAVLRASDDVAARVEALHAAAMKVGGFSHAALVASPFFRMPIGGRVDRWCSPGVKRRADSSRVELPGDRRGCTA